MIQSAAKIIFNTRITGQSFHMGVLSPVLSRESKPGQFVTIKTGDTQDPLLRRPFSIHRVRKNQIEIFYEVVGKGSKHLSQKKTGEFLDVIGPLGNGFSLGDSSGEIPGPIILIGGGMGVAPLVFLAECLKNRKKPGLKQKIIVLIGARTKSHIHCANDFKEIGCEVKIATDDGSCGFHGRITVLFEELLNKKFSLGADNIYACGPVPMMKALCLISGKHNLQTQISLESHMSCGFGACLGCVVNTRSGYKRVCKEGPVFQAEEVIWS